MSSEKVVEILGRPLVSEVVMDTQKKRTQWVYSMFNGYRNVKYMVAFQNDKLTEWRVWIP
jgi:outer membrane protein assembly factor BamE (lipoprotein component of BamABCDE complex)